MRPFRRKSELTLSETASPEQVTRAQTARRTAEVELPLVVPGRFGPLELLEQLGSGAQAEVFRARWVDDSRAEDLGSDEDFAVKIFSASHRVSEGARARFEREARIARELDIDAVCRVLTTGENEGRIWFAMQLVRGKSLAARITQTLRMRARSASALPHAVLLPNCCKEPQSSPLGAELRDVCVAFERWANALHELHGRGVVHRDVKPSNLMLDTEGRAVLLDLGVARAGEEDPHDLTRTGAVVGSPAYMAPEQIRGEHDRIGPGTDIWGLGVCLYEALTLERPFAGMHREELFREILIGEPPPMLAFHPELPAPLRAIVGKAMHKNPRKRYRSMRDLAEDLARARHGEPTRARLPGPATRLGRWAQRRPVLSAVLSSAAVLLLSVLVVTLVTLNSVKSMQEMTETISALSDTQAAGSAVAQGEGDNARHLLEQVPETLTRWGRSDLSMRGFEWKLLRRRLDPSYAKLPIAESDTAGIWIEGRNGAVRILENPLQSDERDQAYRAGTFSPEIATRLHSYRARDGAPLGDPVVLERHRGRIFAAGLSPDGRRCALLTTLPDQDDAAANGAEPSPVDVRKSALWLCVYLDNGRLEYRTRTSFLPRSRSRHHAQVPGLAWAPGGTQLLIAGTDSPYPGEERAHLLLLDVEDRRLGDPLVLSTGNRFRYRVEALALGEGGRFVVALRRDGVTGPARIFRGTLTKEGAKSSLTRVFEPRDRLPQRPLAMHLSASGRMLSVLLRENSSSLNVLSFVRWRIDSDDQFGELVDFLPWPSTRLERARFVEDGHRLWVQRSDHGLELREPDGTVVGERLLPGTLGEAAVVSDAAGELLAAPVGEHVCLFEPSRFGTPELLTRSDGAVRQLSFDQSGERLLVGRRRGNLEAIDLSRTSQLEQRSELGPGRVSFVGASSDYWWVRSRSGVDSRFTGIGAATLGSAESSRSIHAVPGDPVPRSRTALGRSYAATYEPLPAQHAAGRSGARLRDRGKLELRDSSGRVVAATSISGQVQALAVAEDAATVLLWVGDEELVIWDPYRSRAPRVLLSSEGTRLGSKGERVLAISGDGRRIAAGRNRRLVVHDRDAQQSYCFEAGRGQDVSALCFLPHAPLRLVVAHHVGSLSFWAPAAKRESLHLQLDLSYPGALAVDPSGQRLAIGDKEGRVLLLDTRPVQARARDAAPASAESFDLRSELVFLFGRPFRDRELLELLYRQGEADQSKWTERSLPELRLRMRLARLLESPDPAGVEEYLRDCEELVRESAVPAGFAKRIPALAAAALRSVGEHERAEVHAQRIGRRLEFYHWVYCVADSRDGIAGYRAALRALRKAKSESLPDLLPLLAEAQLPARVREIAEEICRSEANWNGRLRVFERTVDCLLVTPPKTEGGRLALLRAARSLQREKIGDSETRDRISMALVRTGRLEEAKTALYRRLHSKSRKRMLSPPLALLAESFRRLETEGPTDDLRRYHRDFVMPVLSQSKHAAQRLLRELNAELQSRIALR
jgi:serine/threonine protein kinase